MSTRTTITGEPLSADRLDRLDAWWRTANYLAVGQIYLMGNPLLREPLRPEHVKPRLLGHWGTTPGQTFVYAHLNRLVMETGTPMMYVAGPGHGGPALVAAAYLDGTWSETYSDVGQDEAGLRRLFTQFSFPGGIPSHVAPEVPGSIHEGGELGYSLAHAYGAAFDNPDLVVACVVGDGEAETGPLAAGWHGHRFVDPRRDGAVLPILHLNGYKIASPTVLARMPEDDLLDMLRGYGHEPYVVSGDDPAQMHQAFAATLDRCLQQIREIQAEGGQPGETDARWPMIVLRSPKGWTGPREVDGEPIEGNFRSHQVPFADARDDDEHRGILETWLRSYRPEELFDDDGAPVAAVRDLHPDGDLRMSASPHANGGVLLRDLRLPDFRDYAVPVEHPGTGAVGATQVLATFLRDVMARNLSTFRMMAPDEHASNRLQDVFDASGRTWEMRTEDGDDHLAVDGRVMETLSEHTCQGWLEGYLLSGRHGMFSCYEAFVHVVDSMFNQHAKWLLESGRISWRRPIASLNYLLTSHVWRQDHNGFSHQDPGFIDHVVNKKADVIRVYLPPDANTLLSVADHCLRSRQYVNVIVAGKQPALQYLAIDDAIVHATKGIGIWEWASSHIDRDPDVVLGCAGDIPTMEVLAATQILRQAFPDLAVRVVNVVDLMRLQSEREHPHGLSEPAFDSLFTRDRPVVFAYHGYPWLIHRLTYKRANHDGFHVRGYIEEGTTTTPFDMVVVNQLDRFDLVMDVIDRVPSLGARAGVVRERMKDALVRHRIYTRSHGEDMPEVRNWEWDPTSEEDWA